MEVNLPLGFIYDFISENILFIIGFVFVVVMLYFYWLDHREKERRLEDRLKRLEEQQQKATHNNEREMNE